MNNHQWRYNFKNINIVNLYHVLASKQITTTVILNIKQSTNELQDIEFFIGHLKSAKGEN